MNPNHQTPGFALRKNAWRVWVPRIVYPDHPLNGTDNEVHVLPYPLTLFPKSSWRRFHDINPSGTTDSHYVCRHCNRDRGEPPAHKRKLFLVAERLCWGFGATLTLSKDINEMLLWQVNYSLGLLDPFIEPPGQKPGGTYSQNNEWYPFASEYEMEAAMTLVSKPDAFSKHSFKTWLGILDAFDPPASDVHEPRQSPLADTDGNARRNVEELAKESITPNQNNVLQPASCSRISQTDSQIGSYRTLVSFYALLDKIERTSYVGSRFLEAYADHVRNDICQDCWFTHLVKPDMSDEDHASLFMPEQSTSAASTSTLASQAQVQEQTASLASSSASSSNLGAVMQQPSTQLQQRRHSPQPQQPDQTATPVQSEALCVSTGSFGNLSPAPNSFLPNRSHAFSPRQYLPPTSLGTAISSRHEAPCARGPALPNSSSTSALSVERNQSIRLASVSSSSTKTSQFPHVPSSEQATPSMHAQRSCPTRAAYPENVEIEGLARPTGGAASSEQRASSRGAASLNQGAIFSPSQAKSSTKAVQLSVGDHIGKDASDGLGSPQIPISTHCRRLWNHAGSAAQIKNDFKAGNPLQVLFNIYRVPGYARVRVQAYLENCAPRAYEEKMTLQCVYAAHIHCTACSPSSISERKETELADKSTQPVSRRSNENGHITISATLQSASSVMTDPRPLNYFVDTENAVLHSALDPAPSTQPLQSIRGGSCHVASRAACYTMVPKKPDTPARPRGLGLSIIAPTSITSLPSSRNCRSPGADGRMTASEGGSLNKIQDTRKSESAPQIGSTGRWNRTRAKNQSSVDSSSRAVVSTLFSTGQSTCLASLEFFFAGLLPTLTFYDAYGLVGRHGGKVTAVPSKRTNYAVLGADVDSIIHQVIKQNNIKSITENGLYELIRCLSTNIEVSSAAGSRAEMRHSVSSPHHINVDPRLETAGRIARETSQRVGVSQGPMTNIQTTLNSDIPTIPVQPTHRVSTDFTTGIPEGTVQAGIGCSKQNTHPEPDTSRETVSIASIELVPSPRRSTSQQKTIARVPSLASPSMSPTREPDRTKETANPSSMTAPAAPSTKSPKTPSSGNSATNRRHDELIKRWKNNHQSIERERLGGHKPAPGKTSDNNQAAKIDSPLQSTPSQRVQPFSSSAKDKAASIRTPSSKHILTPIPKSSQLPKPTPPSSSQPARNSALAAKFAFLTTPLPPLPTAVPARNSHSLSRTAASQKPPSYSQLQSTLKFSSSPVPKSERSPSSQNARRTPLRPTTSNRGSSACPIMCDSPSPPPMVRGRLHGTSTPNGASRGGKAVRNHGRSANGNDVPPPSTAAF